MFNVVETLIEEANQNMDDGSKVKAKSQIDSIKYNLKYLEDNIKKQAGDQMKELEGDKPDFNKIGDLLNKFKGEIPNIEQLAKRLEIGNEVDPFLAAMLKDLDDAIHLENVNKKIEQAKQEVLDNAQKLKDFVAEQERIEAAKTAEQRAKEKAEADKKIMEA